MNKKIIIQAKAGPDRNFITFAEDTGLKNDLANVSGIAYSGGPISQYWSSMKLVIDLTGMQVAPQLPLLYNHYNEPEYRLGEITATIDGKNVLISGGIDRNTERGKFIIDAGKKFNWQLSIGAELDPSMLEEITEDDERTINGQSMKGPFLLVKKTMLREVSVCAVGADPDTTLKIAASLNLSAPKPKTTQENETMNKEFMKYLQAKFNLGDADEKAICAHLEKIGTTIEAEQKAFNAMKQPKNDDSAKKDNDGIQATGLTEDQVKAMVAAQLKMEREAEAKRVSDIQAAAANYSDIATEAIKSNWPVDQVKTIVAALDAQAKKINGSGMNIIVKTNPAVTQKSIEAALCFQHGITEQSITASFKPEEVDAGHKMRGITLKKVLELCCQMEGKNVPVMFGDETIQAAFSTMSLPGILSNVANKKALQAFTAQPIIATKLCKEGDLNDFKVSERYRLTDVGDLEKVSKTGEIKHGGALEDKAVNQLDTYGKMFVISRKDFYNDDLGSFLQVPTAMGQRAARKIDQLFHERLLANPTFTDGKALFHADHNNYLTGSNSALSLEALEAARTLFLTAADSDGQPINVMPKILLVPSALDGLATGLVTSTALVGGNTPAPAFNVISKYGLEVVESPYLQSPAYANYSTTGWYLFGDPNQIDTFEIGYLQGRRVPVVEQGAIDFNTLGMGFRVVFDLGVREQAYQGMVFNKGVL